jgi:hypothetical protein
MDGMMNYRIAIMMWCGAKFVFGTKANEETLLTTHGMDW